MTAPQAQGPAPLEQRRRHKAERRLSSPYLVMNLNVAFVGGRIPIDLSALLVQPRLQLAIVEKHLVNGIGARRIEQVRQPRLPNVEFALVRADGHPVQRRRAQHLQIVQTRSIVIVFQPRRVGNVHALQSRQNGRRAEQKDVCGHMDSFQIVAWADAHAKTFGARR
jgi:hypothetical protein